MIAAQNGNTEIVRILLDLAPNTAVDTRDLAGNTALISAAAYLHVDIIQQLIDRGADVNAENMMG